MLIYFNVRGHTIRTSSFTRQNQWRAQAQELYIEFFTFVTICKLILCTDTMPIGFKIGAPDGDLAGV